MYHNFLRMNSVDFDHLDEMVDEFEEVVLLYRFPDDDHFAELSDSDSEDDTDNMYLDKSDVDLREEKVLRPLIGKVVTAQRFQELSRLWLPAAGNHKQKPNNNYGSNEQRHCRKVPNGTNQLGNGFW